MASLTLFTTCKPFTSEFDRIQTNALRSWTTLQHAADVVVFGDEPGVAERCEELGIRHVGEIPRNSHGTPLLDGLFKTAEKHADTDMLGFVNADILLTSELVNVAERCQVRFREFLLIVRRWNVELDMLWDFSRPDWESQLRAYAHAHGRLELLKGGVDCFVYTRGIWPSLPPFAIGRGAWDNALIYIARKGGIPIIDATPVVTCVHQNHGYSHISENTAGAFKGSEGMTNLTFFEDDDFTRFNAVNATHVFSPLGLHRRIDLNPINLYRRLAVLPFLCPSLRPFLPMFHRITRVARELRAYATAYKP